MYNGYSNAIYTKSTTYPGILFYQPYLENPTYTYSTSYCPTHFLIRKQMDPGTTAPPTPVPTAYPANLTNPNPPASRVNGIVIDGYAYSTLADVSIYMNSISWQTNPMKLPSNWEIAPGDSTAQYLAASYYWSSTVTMTFPFLYFLLIYIYINFQHKDLSYFIWIRIFHPSILLSE